MQSDVSLTQALFWGLVACISLTGRVSAFPGRLLNPRADGPVDSIVRSWSYGIPSQVQNGTAHARFTIPTAGSKLETTALLTLDSPQVRSINSSVFDWWYFDAVSETDPRESLALIFFTSTAAAFPWLPPNETSVLVAYIWASFANGTVFADYLHATIARVAGGEGANPPSSGNWSSTGCSWTAPKDDLSQYEVIVSSKEMQVEGRLSLSSELGPHLPCSIQPGTTTLEIAPHMGWVALKPDAVGQVDITVRGSSLSFQGPAYHDKNWSDRPFEESVQSWYWGHGHIGPYSVVWFSYLAVDDPSHMAYVSGYVARNGAVLVSSCNSTLLSVRPTGAFGTSARYPPRAGDVPDGFHLEFDLGDTGWLRANVSGTVVAGDGKYYVRWAGKMAGEVVQSGGKPGYDAATQSQLHGSAVFEQFVVAA
ncbi:uncharacterized protein N7482_004880 [Penicillium canariense]|uniref:Hydroxyneurosporene synthase n=1 Tax=Penicillium canariense TaxID=189055 RepID=A0A9W9I3Z7_9EURO|nr:uncharacterized protein N7482_004880 [Penicillium canariense]KAJ5166099.1 hypothetical protein N7482_004880 [Penicillium canariense]